VWGRSISGKTIFLTTEVVKRESEDHMDGNKILSSILWDMFTGNERYKEVFNRAISPELILKMTKASFRQFLGI
jgi:hypothetical protein